MTTTRVSTLSLSQASLQSALALQARYAEKTEEESSGLVSSTYGGLGTQASHLISLESAETALNAYSTNTQTADDRVQAMYSAVGSMIDLLTTLRTTISSALSDSSADVATSGTTALSDLASLMNTQLSGRYLFAGGNTDEAPVDTSTLSTPSVPSSADTSYYTGDDEVASVRVSEEQTISYGVTADSSAFEEALRAANLLANATAGDEDTLNEAYELATQAINDLTTIQSQLSISADRLETAQSTQTTTLSLLQDMASNIKSADTAEVSVQVSQYEAQLQASYSALASISKLSLADYL